MTPSPLRALVRRGWLAPLLDLGRQTPSYYRIAFLGAGLRAGFIQRLARPATPETLIDDLGLAPEMIDGLRSWLDLGVTLGELRRDGDAYALRSRRAKALTRAQNDPIAAFYTELVELEHRLITETPARLVEGRPFTLADIDADLIARTSRTSEPWLGVAIAGVVPTSGPVRMVEVGCGSGAHIRTAAALNPALTALGLELEEPAAAQARANVTAWGLGDRVRVEVGDVRDRAGDQSADLVTLHQNIYYFPDDQQADLLRHLGSFLKPGGTLLATSVVRDGGVATSGLDLWGAMTTGAARMPVPHELVARFRAAGYADVACRRLGPDGMYRAFVGRWPGN